MIALRFWYVLPIGLLLAFLLATRGTLADVKAESEARHIAHAELLAATREAAGEPNLSPRDAPAQIRAFGASINALSSGLQTCNASARAAADRDQALQREAAQQLAAADRRVAGLAGQVDRLRASAARPRAAGESCEPSEEVRRSWR